MKALLVGGTQELADTLRVVLRVRWHDLSLSRIEKWRDAVPLVRRDEPTLVLVDCSYDVATCCDLITHIRSFSEVPLVVVGDGEDVTAKVRALETGADDWIHASTIPMEFIARVHALLRRYRLQREEELEPYANGPLSIDFAREEVRISGRRLSLTPIEFKVLCLLARHEGTVVTREAMLATVWGGDSYSDPEFVKKYIHRLRMKLEDDPSEPQMIVNRRGVGYMLATASSTN